MTSDRPGNLRRPAGGTARVTNVELFFDLVYVFAVTQLSHYLLHHSTAAGALQAGLLLVMIWLVWAYTTWVTNWLDPERMAVRLLLVALSRSRCPGPSRTWACGSAAPTPSSRSAGAPSW